PAWYSVFAAAWRETSVVAAGLGLGLALASNTFTDGEELHSLAGSFLAATAFLLAWRYQAPALTWAGSALVLASLGHAFYWNALGLAPLPPIRVALLAHAALAVAAGLLIRAGSTRSPGGLDRLLLQPLVGSGLVSTALAVPLLLIVPEGQSGLFAVYLA